MKKIYIRPEVNVVEMEASEMLAGSMLKLDGSNTVDSEDGVMTNQKDMWGNEGIWG